MKIGDKLYCKEDYNYFGNIYFHYGMEYNINDINYNLDEISVSYAENRFDGCILFSINSINFKKTFACLKENRKNKLKKINEKY